MENALSEVLHGGSAAEVQVKQAKGPSHNLKCANCNVKLTTTELDQGKGIGEGRRLDTMLKLLIQDQSNGQSDQDQDEAEEGLRNAQVTVLEALQIVFQISDYHKLMSGQAKDHLEICSKCLELFKILFHHYMTFVEAASPGSLVQTVLEKRAMVKRHLQNHWTSKHNRMDEESTETVEIGNCPSPTSSLNLEAEPFLTFLQPGPNNHIFHFPQTPQATEHEPKRIAAETNTETIKIEAIEVKVEPVDVYLEDSEPVVSQKTSATGYQAALPGVHAASLNEARTEIIRKLRPSTAPGVNPLRKRKRYKPAPVPQRRLGGFKCSECCEIIMSTSTILQKHEGVHVDISKAKPGRICSICNCGFKTFSSYKHHATKHHAENPTNQEIFRNTCKVCSALFIGMKAFKKHLVSQHFQCPICDQQFKSQDEAENHIGGHGANAMKNTYVCEVCGYKCYLKLNYRRHKTEVHKLGTAKYLCNHCGKGFIGKHGYERHLRVHTGVRPYKCNRCPMSFKNKENLLSHELIHDGLKFICEICGHASSSKPNLRKHIAAIHHDQPQTQTTNKSESRKKRLRLPVALAHASSALVAAPVVPVAVAPTPMVNQEPQPLVITGDPDPGQDPQSFSMDIGSLII